jgi:uncharacterized protein with FMN-binding domain
MKRALLITGGTLGSLAAVFAITPPQIASNQTALDMGGTGMVPTTTPSSAAPAPVVTTAAPTQPATTAAPTQPATTAAPTKSTATPSKSANTPAATQAPVTPAPTTKSVSGTFTGDLSNTGPYGGVITQVTIASGKITDIQVLQAPGGKNQRYTDRAIPTMRERALAAQSTQITAVSGATYTSYNFWKSLASALSKAGI